MVIHGTVTAESGDRYSYEPHIKASVAELAYALDLDSSYWEFESLPRYQINASVVESVYTGDLKSPPLWVAGSSPAAGTSNLPID